MHLAGRTFLFMGVCRYCGESDYEDGQNQQRFLRAEVACSKSSGRVFHYGPYSRDAVGGIYRTLCLYWIFSFYGLCLSPFLPKAAPGSFRPKRLYQSDFYTTVTYLRCRYCRSFGHACTRTRMLAGPKSGKSIVLPSKITSSCGFIC